AVEGKIEAPGQCRIARLPGCPDPLGKTGRNRKLLEAIREDDVLDRGKRKLVQATRRCFELVDFVGGEAIAVLFVPVRSLHRAEAEPYRFTILAPVRARAPRFADHSRQLMGGSRVEAEAIKNRPTH